MIFIQMVNAVLQVPDKAIVMTDYYATAGTDQLTVQKGQQVDVLEMHCPGKPEFSLVRVPQSGLESPIEGIVPMAHLKISQPSTKTNAASLPASPDVDGGERMFCESDSRVILFGFCN